MLNFIQVRFKFLYFYYISIERNCFQSFRESKGLVIIKKKMVSKERKEINLSQFVALVVSVAEFLSLSTAR